LHKGNIATPLKNINYGIKQVTQEEKRSTFQERLKGADGIQTEIQRSRKK
tara:strand:- start:548 stop:697 length:150 start_codon:yes stop_codon:yes gene_type:complete